jgi:V/A-type H+-transporting ATPase subunit I
MTQFMGGFRPHCKGCSLGLTPLWRCWICLACRFIQRGWKGLNEIANLVTVFADVLSYLRLYALSLAGAIMASTFNEEGAGLGLFIGFIIILIGHSVNMG